MKLKELYEIRTGYLRSRVKEGSEQIAVYTKTHFDLDINYLINDRKPLEKDYINLDTNDYLLTKAGNIIIDSLTQKAALISKENKGMFYTFNYFILRPFKTNIDSDYFVSWLNLSDEANGQLNKLLQGTTIKKLTLSQLNEITITLPIIERQREIGKLYKESILKHNLATQIKNNEMDIIKNILTEVEDE